MISELTDCGRSSLGQPRLLLTQHLSIAEQ